MLRVLQQDLQDLLDQVLQRDQVLRVLHQNQVLQVLQQDLPDLQDR